MARVIAVFLFATLVGCVETPPPIGTVPDEACSAGFKTSGTFVASEARPIDPETNQPITGCWPVGTWTFTVAHDASAEVPGDRCASEPALMPSYTFRVDRVEGSDGQGFTDKYFAKCGAQFYDLSDRTDADRDEWPDTLETCNAQLGGYQIVRLKVTEGGGGECEGGLEIFDSTFQKYWNLKPSLTGDLIDGFGEYIEYKTPQTR